MYLLTSQKSLQLRGMAIFLIIIHNFCHWLPNAIRENEYSWSIDPIQQYGQYILNGGPHLILNLFSHYGFYGIVLFIFLSGYGLATKYDQLERLSPVHFLVQHATKLWRLLFVGILVYYIDFRLLGGAYQPSWEHIIKLATFVSNIIPSHPFFFGPWWWFSLIMQFYVVYYIFYYKRSLRFVLIFTLLCLLLQYAVIFYCHVLVDKYGLLEHLQYNFPAHVLPFSLGVFAARRHPSWLDSRHLLVLSILIVILGSFNIWIWCISNVFACIALLQLGHLLCNAGWIRSTMSWIGMVSAWAFVIHPIVRSDVFRLNATHSVYFTLPLYLVITLVLSFILYKIMVYIDQKTFSTNAH